MLSTINNLESTSLSKSLVSRLTQLATCNLPTNRRSKPRISLSGGGCSCSSSSEKCHRRAELELELELELEGGSNACPLSFLPKTEIDFLYISNVYKKPYTDIHPGGLSCYSSYKKHKKKKSCRISIDDMTCALFFTYMKVFRPVERRAFFLQNQTRALASACSHLDFLLGCL